MNSFIKISEIQNFIDKYEVTFEEPKICVTYENKQWYRIATASHNLSTGEWIALLVKTLVASIFTCGFGKNLKENWSAVFSWKEIIILHVEKENVKEVVSLYLPNFLPKTDKSTKMSQIESTLSESTESDSSSQTEDASIKIDSVSKTINPIKINTTEKPSIVDPVIEQDQSKQLPQNNQLPIQALPASPLSEELSAPPIIEKPIEPVAVPLPEQLGELIFLGRQPNASLTYFTKLNALLNDDNFELTLVNNVSFKQDLLNHLFCSNQRPQIPITEMDLQKKLINLLFSEGSDEQLSQFIQQESKFPRESFKTIFFDYSLPSACYRFMEFLPSFLNGLNEERQERLLPLLNKGEPTSGEIILHVLSHYIKSREVAYPRKLQVYDYDFEPCILANQLVYRFYKSAPDCSVWNTIKSLHEDRYEKRYLRDAIAKAEILYLLKQPLIENDPDQSEFVKKIHSGYQIFSTHGRAYEYCIEPAIESFIYQLAKLQQENDPEVLEKLQAFVKGSRDYFLAINKAVLGCELLSKDLEKKELFERTVFKALFSVGLQLEWNKTLILDLARQVPFSKPFLEECLLLPEPIQTVVLSKWIHATRRYLDEFSIKDSEYLEMRLGSLEAYPNIKSYCFNAIEKQKEVEEFTNINSADELFAWVTKNKTNDASLQALAGGILLPNGKLIKTNVDPEIIKQAFNKAKLLYEGYTEQVSLVEFLK